MSILNNIKIRQSKADDIPVLVGMLEEEGGWDNTEFDCQAELRLDPQSILVAADSSDQPLGFLGVSLAVEDNYYLGHYIVRKDLRNKGIGRKLWATMLDRTKDANVILDGVEKMVPWYKSQGFHFESFKIRNFAGSVTDEMKQRKQSSDQGYEVVPLTSELWPALLNYDRDVYQGIDRGNILRAWLTGDCADVFVAINSNVVVGFGSAINSYEDRFCIQTVTADSESIAESILDRLIEKMPAGAVASFALVADKPLPGCFASFEETLREQRLFTKYEIDTKREKLFMINHHYL